MSAPFSFAEARPLARHCAELLARTAGEAVVDSCLAEKASQIAAPLGLQLSRFCGAATSRISCRVLDACEAKALAGTMDPLAVSAALEVPDIAGALAIGMSGRDLLALTERLFGGTMPIDDVFPEELPLTASLVAAQVFTIFTETFGNVLAMDTPPGAATQPSAASPLAQISGQAGCRMAVFTIAQPNQPAWSLILAVSAKAHGELFRAPDTQPCGPAGADAAAIIPMELHAVMAELSLPLATVSRLRPGDLLPFLPPRAVQLRIGELAIADGSIGGVDGQVALQLTRVF